MGRASYRVPSYLLYIEKEVAKRKNNYEFMSSGKCLGSWLIGQLSERSNDRDKNVWEKAYKWLYK